MANLSIKKRVNCPHCSLGFISVSFEGLTGIFCPYCNSRVKP